MEKFVTDFNTGVIEEFRANQGKVGGMFEGANMLLLHSTGHRSGKTSVIPLVYFQDSDQLIIIASKGGAPENPAWYHNLKANPGTTIEIGAEAKTVAASEITGEERERVWQDIVAKAPGFGDYQKNTSRIIPVIALNPA
jgi:deazaflavin-dependent oxidoreductase (nitroreductase family)